MSSDHHFIKPGTDALLLLAMINTLFATNKEAPARLLEFAPHLLEVKDYILPYTPHKVATKIGMTEAQIEQLVSDFCAAESAVCYGRMGASVQAFGTLTQYLIMLFNMLTGNLDKPGGMMFTQPAADFLPHSGRGSIGNFHTRVRKLPAFAGEFPVSALAEEMTTPGEGQIKAMVIGAGNPVLTTPNGQRLDAAFENLDFVVAVDFYMTETTRHANIILPPVTALERDHYDIVFHNFAVRNSTKYSPAIFPPEANSKTDWQIYLGLAERLDKLNGLPTDKYQLLWDKKPTGVVDDMLQMGRYQHAGKPISIATLLDLPHGIDLGPLQADLPDAIFHNDKKIDMSFDYFMPDLTRVNKHFFETDVLDDNSLQLIGRRHLKTNNSWLHNSKRMVKGTNNGLSRCTAQIHPDDAAKFAIQDKQMINVKSRVGEISLPAEITHKIMPGVISIPHGWGHNKKGMRWKTAEQHAGVSVNDLTDEMVIDELSGNAVLNGVPVWIEASV
jgi:anaerobic selenocysteine-containing dehydrogenase